MFWEPDYRCLDRRTVGKEHCRRGKGEVSKSKWRGFLEKNGA